MSLIKEFLLSNMHEGIHLKPCRGPKCIDHPLFSVASPNYGGYGTQGVGDPTFGTLTSMSPIGPRQAQLAVKLSLEGSSGRQRAISSAAARARAGQLFGSGASMKVTALSRSFFFAHHCMQSERSAFCSR